MKADRLALLVVAIVVLTYGVIYPNAAVVASSFQRAGTWTLANYHEVLSQGVVIEAIVSSLGLSIATVLLCALVGVPLAFLFERFTFPGRRLFAAIAALPLVLPPLVGTVAFIFLAGETGILAHGIQNLFGLQNPPWRLVGWPALLLFHTYTLYPFFYVLTGAGLRRIDASLAEAARSLGGSRVFVFTRVLAPQLTPSLIAAALLTFMTSMASFSAPLLFGGNVRVLTLEIFTARQRGDMVMAVTETVILAVISLAALVVFQRYEGTRKFAAATMKGAPRRRVTIASGKARALAAAIAVIFAIVLVLPVATLFLVSFAREGSWTTQTLPSAYTFENYQRIFSDPFAAEVFFNSFSMSAIAALAALVWSFCVVTLLVKRDRGKSAFLGKNGRRLLSLLILVPWALPGTVVAVSVAEAYGQPSLLLGSFVLVGTFWILPVV
jgi:iron(III) transport system permease protein